MRVLARDSEELLRVTAGELGDRARKARDRLAAAVARAKETCEDLQEQGYASARSAVKRADATVRAHPYESIAIALGVGLLVGVVLLSGDDDAS